MTFRRRSAAYVEDSIPPSELVATIIMVIKSRVHHPLTVTLAKGLILAGILLSPTVLVAESITVFGMPFRVDALRPVDATSVELVMGDEHRLVAKESLHDAVVDIYFKPNGRAISADPAIIESFIKESLRQGNSATAGLALPSYLSSPRLDTVSALTAIEEFAELDGSGEAFKRALMMIRANGEAFSEFRRRPEIVSIVLFTIGLSDGPWLRSNGIRWIFAFSESFQGYVMDRLARAAAEGDRELIQKIPAIALDTLGEEEGFSRKVRVLSERLLQVLTYTPGSQIEDLFLLVEASRRDADTARIVYPLVGLRLHDEAETAISQGAGLRALTILSRSDIDRRTPRTHDLIQRALELVSADDREFVRDSILEEALAQLSQKDFQIRQRYEQLLERQIYHAVSSGEVLRASALLSKLTKVRTDPDPRNDDLRIELALAELRQGSREGALAQLSAVRNGIPVISRIRLSLAGLYFSPLFAFVCIVVPAVYVVWFLLVELRRLRAFRLAQPSREHGHRVAGTSPHSHAHGSEQVESSGEAETEAGPEMSPEAERKFFTQGVLRKPSDPRLVEYGQCLTVLGLPQTATIKEIKTAYRGLVKHIHPDRVQEVENHCRASDRFIDLTQAYDRAIELRRLTGIDEV